MVSVQPNMQYNVQLHDDLATLFSRNLTFNPDSIPRESPNQDPSPAPAPAPPQQPIVYSISQHYHHSAHTVKPQPQPEVRAPEPEPAPAPVQDELHRRCSEPSQSDALTSEVILRKHGVDPGNLTPSQLQLFRIADQTQKIRLIELWSICPPSNGGDIPALAWSSTTIEQEEQLAQLRYERLQQNQVMSLDGTAVQAGNGTWHDSASDGEPYITSGYEELMRREQEREARERQSKENYNHWGTAVAHYSPATDPVYMGPNYAQQQQQQQMAMATQYGAFQQYRAAVEMDAMDVIM